MSLTSLLPFYSSTFLRKITAKFKVFVKTFVSNLSLNNSGVFPPSQSTSSLFTPLQFLLKMLFLYSLNLILNENSYCPDVISSTIIKISDSKLASCLGKLFRVFDFDLLVIIQPVPKNEASFYLFNNHTVVLTSYFPNFVINP